MNDALCSKGTILVNLQSEPLGLGDNTSCPPIQGRGCWKLERAKNSWFSVLPLHPGAPHAHTWWFPKDILHALVMVQPHTLRFSGVFSPYAVDSSSGAPNEALAYCDRSWSQQELEVTSTSYQWHGHGFYLVTQVYTMKNMENVLLLFKLDTY